ncbi:MAG TPA: alpha/beta hydrolase [Gemmatimonadaceae bacterium]|nr:alpha/beta hydrolase [Gemmatimonadaceae bacterium]
MITTRPIDTIISAGWREQRVHANGVWQHIWRTGGGGAPLVALPGFQEIGLTWARVAKRLENDFDIIMVDFRGQGRTERGTATYSQALLVQDVVALLGELDLSSTSLIGFSNGAGVAAELAATHPSLVARAVLEDPPWNAARTAGLADSPQYQEWHVRWLEWLERFQGADPVEQVAMIGSQIPQAGAPWPNEELIAFAESYAQLDIDFVRDPAPLWKVVNRPLDSLLGEIRCPTLLLESTRRMPGLPGVGGPSARPPIPSNVACIEFDTGHFIRREQFDRYMAVVERFLRAL